MTSEAPRFLASELPLRPAEECCFHIIPVPFEATVSYGGGTALGPKAILEASSQLEVWTGRAVPSRQGIYTWPAVECHGSAEDVLERIAAATRTALSQGPQQGQGAAHATGSGARHAASDAVRHAGSFTPTVPILLGGEHTVSLGALRALKEFHGDFGIVQFDAHADLRDSYEGSPFSHACVMRRAVQDMGLSLFQIGVRSLSLDEELYRRAQGIAHLDAREGCSPDILCEFSLPDNFPEKLYLSFDLDALDASLMPATGTPEPGGLFWRDALNLVERSLAGRTCVGFDVVELAPVEGLHAPTYTAARLVHEIMGILVGPSPL